MTAAPACDSGADAAEPRTHSPVFAALAVPNFRRYVSGQKLSLIGTWVETVAQALLVRSTIPPVRPSSAAISFPTR